MAQRTSRTFKNWRDLASLDYFELLDDGRLALVADGVQDCVDMHTHFGCTFLIAKPIDLMAKPPLKHNFEPDLPVNLDLYSGEDFHNVRPDWAMEDYKGQALAWTGNPKYKHVSHTIPNLLWEMDALKIKYSVSLCLDITNSGNSRRILEAARNEPRIIVYPCLHPKDRNARAKIEEYVAAGALGMKMHPEIVRTAIDDESSLNLARMWAEISNGMPVLPHSGFNGFEPEKVREHANIEKYEPLCALLAESGTPCILGHTAMNQYKKATALAQKYETVYLEIGGQPPAHLKWIIDTIGYDRLVYGTDWPVYPQAIPMAKVLITTEEYPEARMPILRDNAMRLINYAKEKSKAGAAI